MKIRRMVCVSRSLSCWSGGLERIYQFESEPEKTGNITGCKRGAITQRNRRNQRIHLPDRATRPLAKSHHRAVLLGRFGIECQYSAAKELVLNALNCDAQGP